MLLAFLRPWSHHSRSRTVPEAVRYFCRRMHTHTHTHGVLTYLYIQLYMRRQACSKSPTSTRTSRQAQLQRMTTESTTKTLAPARAADCYAL